MLQCLGNRLYLVLRNSQSSFPLTAHFSILSELGLRLLKLPMHRDEEDELESHAREETDNQSKAEQRTNALPREAPFAGSRSLNRFLLHCIKDIKHFREV